MEGRGATSPAGASVCVFAPWPILTITIERIGTGEDSHYVHAGGQGFWVARMVCGIGVDACLAAPLGGDTGFVIRHLIEREGVAFCGVEVQSANGSYVHDRRGGERETISEVHGEQLSRHEVDDLYDATLVAALDATIFVLTGPLPPDILPADVYTRLARDVARNGVPVVADLSGEALTATLEGGIDVLKVSHEELIRQGLLTDYNLPEVVAAARELHAAGARNAIVSCAENPAIALIEGEPWEVHTPYLMPLDFHGAGDSMTAGITAGLARGYSLLEAIRLGAAAGSLNVTRHGLGTGRREHIEQMSRHVEIRRYRG